MPRRRPGKRILCGEEETWEEDSRDKEETSEEDSRDEEDTWGKKSDRKEEKNLLRWAEKNRTLPKPKSSTPIEDLHVAYPARSRPLRSY